MAPIVHIIDPDPDTVIVLKNPCTIFARWKPELGQQPNDADDWGSTARRIIKKTKKKGKKGSTPAPSLPPELRSAEIPEDSSMLTLDHGSTAPAEASSAMQHTPPPIAPEEPGELEEQSIHYHVSSRHLMLASSTFKRMLAQDGFAESVRNEADGLYHIAASHWDPEAFLIVLQIVHGRNKQVPREISLEMLAKIAVLEDYYNFGEALDVFTEVWVQSLTKTSIPTTYCRDLVLWVWVAWVFNLEEQFTQATTIVITQSTGSVQTLDLPIPTIVSDELDCKRYQAIESVVAELYQHLDKYRRTDYACPSNSNLSFECGSFFLGSMMKEMSRLGLYETRPEVPFPDISFSALCGQVQGMQSPSWIHEAFRGHDCTLGMVTETLIKDVSKTVVGLSLSELKHR